VAYFYWATLYIVVGVGTSVDIDDETKRILLRSRQATSRPSPEPSPVSSELGSVEDLTSEAAADEKAKEHGVLDREVHLQEADPATFLEFGAEIWRQVQYRTQVRRLIACSSPFSFTYWLAVVEFIRKEHSFVHVYVLPQLELSAPRYLQHRLVQVAVT